MAMGGVYAGHYGISPSRMRIVHLVCVKDGLYRKKKGTKSHFVQYLFPCTVK